MYRTEGRLTEELETQTKLATQHEATINAYRQLVADDANFALKQTPQGAFRWRTLTSSTHGS